MEHDGRGSSSPPRSLGASEPRSLGASEPRSLGASEPRSGPSSLLPWPGAIAITTGGEWRRLQREAHLACAVAVDLLVPTTRRGGAVQR